MLHDTARNKAYATWVRQLTANAMRISKEKPDKQFLWCDIGTGSGFLGCLAARHDCNKVVSFETVPELASRARETICNNMFIDNNVVWLAHTSQLDEHFMKNNYGRGADFIVSELLDTGFLGEGLVEGMRHARSCLLDRECSREGLDLNVVPRYGRVLIQAWSGESLQRMHGYKASMLRKELSVILPASVLNCKGPNSGSTIHAAPLLDDAIPVSSVETVYLFDMLHMDDEGTLGGYKFDKVSSDGKEKKISMHSIANGIVDAYVMWWEVGMNPDFDRVNSRKGEEMYISTSPMRPGASPPPDHWRQIVFFQNASDTYQSEIGLDWELRCCCNESDIWLSNGSGSSEGVFAERSDVCAPPLPRKRRKLEQIDSKSIMADHVCSCGNHSINSCFRIQYMNSDSYYYFLKRTTERLLARFLEAQSDNSCEQVIVLGDTPILFTYVVKEIRRLLTRSPDAVSMPTNMCFTGITGSATAVKSYRDFLLANIPSVSDCENSSDDTTGNSHFVGKEVLRGCTVSYCVYSMSNDEENSGSIGLEKDDTDSSPTSANLIAMEPYFASLQCEWGMEHAITAWQTMSCVHEKYCGQLSWPEPVVVDIHMSLFSGDELWKQYRRDVTFAEGIDVSSMNQLLEDCSGERAKIVDSINFNQWGASLVSCRRDCGRETIFSMLLGSITLSDPLTPEVPWEASADIEVPNIQSDAIFSVGSSGGELKSSSKVHGVVFWTSFRYGDCVFIDHNPLNKYQHTQAICCFDEPHEMRSEVGVKCITKECSRDRHVLTICGCIDKNLEYTVHIAD